MQHRQWVIATVVVGGVSLGLSGVLKNDNSGLLGVLSSAAWVTFLLSVVILVVLSVVALLRHGRSRHPTSRA